MYAILGHTEYLTTDTIIHFTTRYTSLHELVIYKYL